MTGELFPDLPMPTHFSPARRQYHARSHRPEAQSARYWARQMAHAPTPERKAYCHRMMMLSTLALSREGNEHERFVA